MCHRLNKFLSSDFNVFSYHWRKESEQNRRVWTKIIHLTALPAEGISKPAINALSKIEIEENGR